MRTRVKHTQVGPLHVRIIRVVHEGGRKRLNSLRKRHWVSKELRAGRNLPVGNLPDRWENSDSRWQIHGQHFVPPCSFLLRAAMLSPAAFLHAFSLRSFWPKERALGRDFLTWERGLSFSPLPWLCWTQKHRTLEASYRHAWGSIAWKSQVGQDGWGRIQNLVQRKRLKSSSRNTLFKTLVCLQLKDHT